jgi:hypothetical protein
MGRGLVSDVMRGLGSGRVEAERRGRIACIYGVLKGGSAIEEHESGEHIIVYQHSSIYKRLSQTNPTHPTEPKTQLPRRPPFPW